MDKEYSQEVIEAFEAERIAALPPELQYIERINRNALKPFGNAVWVIGRMVGFYK